MICGSCIHGGVSKNLDFTNPKGMVDILMSGFGYVCNLGTKPTQAATRNMDGIPEVTENCCLYIPKKPDGV